MNNTVDGEYQNFKAKGGAYTRKKTFCSKHPEALDLVENMTDDEIEKLNRGGMILKKFSMLILQLMNVLINLL